MLNIPNALTLFRIVLVPLLIVVLLTEIQDKQFWGLGIFLVAALTDALDGFLARYLHAQTVLGALLDPIADKLLMSATFIALVELELAPSWMVAVIVGREFAVTGLRLIALQLGEEIKVNWIGKAKTVSQVVAAAALILGIRPGVAFDHGNQLWHELGGWLLWIALVLTVWSMVAYFKEAWPIIVAADSEPLVEQAAESEDGD